MSLPPDPILSTLVDIGHAVDDGCVARAIELAVRAGLHDLAGRLAASLLLEADHA